MMKKYCDDDFLACILLDNVKVGADDMHICSGTTCTLIGRATVIK